MLSEAHISDFVPYPASALARRTRAAKETSHTEVLFNRLHHKLKLNMGNAKQAIPYNKSKKIDKKFGCLFHIPLVSLEGLNHTFEVIVSLSILRIN